jgi:hypothetical protein
MMVDQTRRIDLQLTATLGNDAAPSLRAPDLLLSIRNAGRRVAVVRAVGFWVGLFPAWSPIWPREPFILRAKHLNLHVELQDDQDFGYTESFRPAIVQIMARRPGE